MTTFVDYTNLPAGPLADGQGVNLIRDGYPDTKFIWTIPAGPWIEVEDVGGQRAAATALQQITQKFEYDVTIDGGSVGEHPMRGVAIPEGVIVIGTGVDILTEIAGEANATIKLQLQSTNDLGSVAQSLPRSVGTGSRTASNVAFATTGGAILTGGSIKTTAPRIPVVIIGTAAATSGTMNFYLTYLSGI